MTHKLYSDVWKAPLNAKLVIEVRSETPHSLVVGVDSYVADLTLTGNGQWQQMVLSPADFRSRSDGALKNWQGIMLLKLGPKGKSDSKPEFRNLRWVKD